MRCPRRSGIVRACVRACASECANVAVSSPAGQACTVPCTEPAALSVTLAEFLPHIATDLVARRRVLLRTPRRQRSYVCKDGEMSARSAIPKWMRGNVANSRMATHLVSTNTYNVHFGLSRLRMGITRWQHVTLSLSRGRCDGEPRQDRPQAAHASRYKQS